MCKTDGCEKKEVARGWCRTCYGRNYMRRKRNVNSQTEPDGFKNKQRWGSRKYDAQHAYMKANFGTAKNYKCDACEGQAHEWAFIKKWCPDDELLSEMRQGHQIHYSLNSSYYVPMCRQHHRAIDSYLRFFNVVEKYV